MHLSASPSLGLRTSYIRIDTADQVEITHYRMLISYAIMTERLALNQNRLIHSKASHRKRQKMGYIFEPNAVKNKCKRRHGHISIAYIKYSAWDKRDAYRRHPFHLQDDRDNKAKVYISIENHVEVYITRN